MKTRNLALVFAAVVVAACLSVPGNASAQSPAALPMKDSVPASQSSAIDGVWTISTLGKRIRIEGGRAYAVDSWIHAFLWEVQPDMVVLGEPTNLDVYRGQRGRVDVEFLQLTIDA